MCSYLKTRALEITGWPVAAKNIIGRLPGIHCIKSIVIEFGLQRIAMLCEEYLVESPKTLRITVE